jgi:hypothetical protein
MGAERSQETSGERHTCKHERAFPARAITLSQCLTPPGWPTGALEIDAARRPVCLPEEIGPPIDSFANFFWVTP